MMYSKIAKESITIVSALCFKIDCLEKGLNFFKSPDNVNVLFSHRSHEIF